jgi:hypothetical protein
VGSLAGSMRETRLAGAIALLSCTAALLGCGARGDSTLPTGSVPTAPTVAETGQEKPGSPQYAALRWWQAVQLDKPARALTLYAKQPSLPDLAGQFNVLGDALDGVPKIEQVKHEGSRTVLVIDWTKRKQRPHSIKVQLRMVRSGGEWKLADNRLLNVLLQQREEQSQGAGQ